MILLQALYNIDSDRQLCEEVGYNLAYRWFCKPSLADVVPDHSSMIKTRDHPGEKIYKEILNEFKKKLWERMWKMQAQVYVISIIQNLKRLASAELDELKRSIEN